MQQITSEYLNSLPLRTVKDQLVRYDEANQMIYLLDDKQNWTGKSCRIRSKAHDPSQNVPQSVPLPASNNVPAPEKPANDPGGQETGQEPPPQPVSLEPEEAESPVPKKPSEAAPEEPRTVPLGAETSSPEPKVPGSGRKIPVKKIFLCLIAAIAVVLSIFLLSRKDGDEPADVGTTVPSTEALETLPPSTPTKQSTAVETQPQNLAEVLSVTVQLLPGEAFSKENLQITEIPLEEYLRLSANVGCYSGQDLDAVCGLYANKYLPAGSFVTFDNAVTVFAPTNPWAALEPGTISVDVPVKVTPDTLSEYMFGNHIALHLTIQTQQTNTEESQEEPLNGLTPSNTVVESTVTSTYTLSGVKIVDVLGADKESLYPLYSAFASVPDAYLSSCLAERYADLQAITQIIPAYIRLAVSEDQGKALANLDLSSVEIALTASAAEINTETQDKASTELQNLIPVLKQLWADLEE